MAAINGHSEVMVRLLVHENMNRGTDVTEDKWGDGNKIWAGAS